MPAADVIQPSASIASTGKGIRYVSNWAYGYSGEISVANTELSFLEFTSGSGIIVGKIQLGSKAAENEDYEFKIYFNEVVVFSNTFHQQGASYVDIANYIPIIIPPLTGVKVTLDNIADTDSRTWSVILTGRVYGV